MEHRENAIWHERRERKETLIHQSRSVRTNAPNANRLGASGKRYSYPRRGEEGATFRWPMTQCIAWSARRQTGAGENLLALNAVPPQAWTRTDTRTHVSRTISGRSALCSTTRRASPRGSAQKVVRFARSLFWGSGCTCTRLMTHGGTETQHHLAISSEGQCLSTNEGKSHTEMSKKMRLTTSQILWTEGHG